MSSELQRLLTNPLVLNFAAAVFALERVYDVFLSDKFNAAHGHFVVVLIYSVGFLVAVPVQAGWLSEKTRVSKAEFTSYGLFIAASVWLLVCVASDLGHLDWYWCLYEVNKSDPACS